MIEKGFNSQTKCVSSWNTLPMRYTFPTYSLVINLHLIDQMTIGQLRGLYCGSPFTHQIVYLATLPAVEMNMRMNVSIIAHAVIIDGNHLCCMMLREEAKSIVDGRTAQ